MCGEVWVRWVVLPLWPKLLLGALGNALPPARISPRVTVFTYYYFVRYDPKQWQTQAALASGSIEIHMSAQAWSHMQNHMSAHAWP